MEIDARGRSTVARDSRALTIVEQDRARLIRWALAFVIGVALAVGVGLVLPI
jgi:hypothetical protein